MLKNKDYIDRDAVLDRIEEILYCRQITADQRHLIVELGNYIAELPRERLCQNDLPVAQKEEKSN